ncbi:MAG: hypothetical protein AAF334_00190, partial [Pseudomonadota bacterium]
MTMMESPFALSPFGHSPLRQGWAVGGPGVAFGPSDDFTSLSSVWDKQGAATGTASIGSDTNDSWLALFVGAGDNNLWDTNKDATRIMRPIEDGDFEIAVRMLGEPSERFQTQGLLVEQDETNWIRFDVYHDGTVLRVFTAVTVNGVSTQSSNTVV